jgi:hypothetical protein
MWNKPMARGLPFADTEPGTVPMSFGDDTSDLDTVPMPLADVVTAAPFPPAVRQADVDAVLAELRRDNRVCPQPAQWLEFFGVLVAAAEGARLPAPPLVGSAWAATPALAKRMCFLEQVEWAAAQGCLQQAWDFLRGLSEGEWHYMG